VDKALAEGYLRNLEDKRNRPAKLVLGDPLPDDAEILPDPEELRGVCTYARQSGGMDPLLPTRRGKGGPDQGQAEDDPVPSAVELGVEDMQEG
jgi:hypothetical protein